MSKCKTVTLRKRKIKNGTQYSLCLDYYPGYRDNTTIIIIRIIPVTVGAVRKVFR